MLAAHAGERRRKARLGVPDTPEIDGRPHVALGSSTALAATAVVVLAMPVMSAVAGLYATTVCVV